MTNAQAALQELRSYQGQNYWQDVFGANSVDWVRTDAEGGSGIGYSEVIFLDNSRLGVHEEEYHRSGLAAYHIAE